jgi:Putative MetA-pathway of phenol degradation
VNKEGVSGERLAVSGEPKSTHGQLITGFAWTLKRLLGLPLTAYRSLLTAVLLIPLTAYRSPLTALQIQDNSFLIEEAYNQEAGVVQHISAFQRNDGGDWGYSFTQEWPLGGIRHQLSYTVPIEHADGLGTGFGDIGLNYRYQLAGHPDARTVMAPRFTVLLPTGNEDRDRGAGGIGFQGNFPLTLILGDRLATHWNAGATVTPSARNALGNQATTADFNLGASAIWLVRPSVNLVLEAIWLSAESVIGEGTSRREDTTLLNPGLRAAFDFAGGLQIVPGVAYTIGISPDEAQDGLFVYLSFEHAFKRQ